MAPNSRGSWLSVIYVLLVIVFFVFTMTTMSTWAQTQENYGSFWREPFHSYNTAPSGINWRCFLRTTWNCLTDMTVKTHVVHDGSICPLTIRMRCLWSLGITQLVRSAGDQSLEPRNSTAEGLRMHSARVHHWLDFRLPEPSMLTAFAVLFSFEVVRCCSDNYHTFWQEWKSKLM